MTGYQVKVCEIVAETAEAVTLVLDIPGDLLGRFGYLPGQFLTVRVPSTRTGSVARCYSLSSSPHCDDRLAITVKRTAGGYASNWICDHLNPGDVLETLGPAGVFTPRSLDRPVLLCAGGSGITPVMSITKSILAAGAGRVVLCYANRDLASIIFAEQLQRLTEQFPERLTVLHWLQSERGLPTATDLATLLRPYRDNEVFLCGPTGFTEVTRAAMNRLQVPPLRILQENYVSLTDNPFERTVTAGTPTAGTNGAATVQVDIDGETHRLPWPRTKKLLDVLLEHGIDAPYVCRESACGTCVCSVRSGRTRMLMNESLIEDELEAGLTLACQTLPESDEVHIAFDQ